MSKILLHKFKEKMKKYNQYGVKNNEFYKKCVKTNM